MDNRLTGLPTLAYLGVDTVNPTSQGVFELTRSPGLNDKKNRVIGDLVINRANDTVWMLNSLANNSATWKAINIVAGIAVQYDEDSGSAYPLNSVLNILGDSNLFVTSASGNTITLGLTNGSNGQVLIGGGPAMKWANITSNSSTITITNAANSINLEAVLSLSTYLVADDTGHANHAAGVITIAGGTNCTTVSDGVNSLTINLNNNITVGNSLTMSAQGAGVVQSSAGGVISSSNGTDGQVLIGGAATPTWANITSGGTITVTNGSNTIDISRAKDKEPFVYYLGTAVTSLSTGTYYLGANQALTATVSNTDFYVGDGAGSEATYTAPATGKYYITLEAYLVRINLTSTDRTITVNAKIETPTRDYISEAAERRDAGSDGVSQYVYNFSRTVHACMDLTLNDVVKFSIGFPSSLGSGESYKIEKAYISGYLVYG